MTGHRAAFANALAVLILTLATPAFAQQPPPGKGLETLTRICTSCHGMELILTLRHSRKDWTGVVDSMKDMGAQATTSEVAEILDYLALNFGPQKTETASAKKSAVPRSVPWERNPLRIGQALYREYCIVCHDVEREETRKLGPSFRGAKRSASYIAARIKSGGTLMPAFAGKLTDTEIEALIRYLASK